MCTELIGKMLDSPKFPAEDTVKAYIICGQNSN